MKSDFTEHLDVSHINNFYGVIIYWVSSIVLENVEKTKEAFASVAL